MAHVRLKGNRWYIEFNDARGKRQTTPTTAQSKTKARGLTLELERKIERQRLEPLPSDSTTTFWELCDWWLQRRCRPRSREDET